MKQKYGGRSQGRTYEMTKNKKDYVVWAEKWMGLILNMSFQGYSGDPRKLIGSFAKMVSRKLDSPRVGEEVDLYVRPTQRGDPIDDTNFYDPKKATHYTKMVVTETFYEDGTLRNHYSLEHYGTEHIKRKDE